jgi:hypothetical protein
MLTDLTTLHEELLEAMAVVARVVSAPTPKPDLVASTRLRLAQLSRRHRRLVNEDILPTIEASGDARAADVARRLRAEDAEMMRRTTAHVATWTSEAILADWRGYQVACTKMRALVRDRLALECRLLVPLMEELSFSVGSRYGRSTSPRPTPPAETPRSRLG